MNDAADDAPMLEVVDALRHYGVTLALDHVSVAARSGEFLTILGESGSSCSTARSALCGQVQGVREYVALRGGGREGDQLVVVVSDAALRGRPGCESLLQPGSATFLAVPQEQIDGLKTNEAKIAQKFAKPLVSTTTPANADAIEEEWQRFLNAWCQGGGALSDRCRRPSPPPADR